MKIATDLAAHLPTSWRLTDSDDLDAWSKRHACEKCQKAVAFELEIRSRHAKRSLPTHNNQTPRGTQ